jgi:hypothetical protein
MELPNQVPSIPGALIRFTENVPTKLSDSVRVGVGVEAKPGMLLLTMPRIGRFVALQGQSVDVQLRSGAEPELVRLILAGTMRAALIHQRGELALEATAVVAPSGACVALCGHSGLGKSTLAAALVRLGWKLLSDGVVRVTYEGGVARAWPGDGTMKLWRNACDLLGISTTGCRLVRKQIEKFYVPMPGVETPEALTAVIRLSPEAACRLVSVDGDNRLLLLSDSTYRVAQVEALGMTNSCLRTAQGVAKQTTISILEGARKCDVSELAASIGKAVA